MNVETISDSQPIIIKKKGRSSLALKGFAVVFGIGLLSVVIYKAGFHAILASLSKIGWYFLVIIALNGSRHLLRALSVYMAVPNRQRDFKYRDAVAARLGGEAAGIVTFTGALVSEATKAALLKNRLSLADRVATIVVDNLIYGISVILVILSGACMMLYTFGHGDKAVSGALLIVAGLMCLAIFGLVMLAKHKFKPMSHILRKYGHARWVPNFLVKREEHFIRLETSVLEFYATRRHAFYSMLGINFFAHALSVIEVMFVLSLLGFKPGVATAYMIESLTKIINFSFSFIPGNLGIYEGGGGVILQILGFTAATGVALALVRRGAMLSWAAVGILILIWRTITENVEKSGSREAETV
ncbi:MAG: flippase-like domain-containing protein [Saprospiraceae bacterium]|nr:flippase-like domain-containing protein [Pyrinomonadaceae bacterium]